jgi:TonB family protein
MRVIMALALALAGFGSAAAADLTDPLWEKAPDRAEWAKAYPSAAAKAGLAGDVKLRCAADGAGLLRNCAVISETPIGQGFGDAALALASGMALKPRAIDGRPVAGRSLIVPVRFDSSLLHPGAPVVNPSWLRLPSNDEMVSYYPAGVPNGGGTVTIVCTVTVRGLMDSCGVKSETPAGHGLGNSAVAMAALFQMRPMTIDGLPVGGAQVTIPIRFAGGTPRPQEGVSTEVITMAPWLSAPTPAEIAAAFPKAAIGKIASAHVMLRCGIQTNGRLIGCDSVSVSPPMQGFREAALSLTKRFTVITNPKTDNLDNLLVDVPFDFRDPSQPQPRVEVRNPVWLRQINSVGAAQIYPAAASKAGVRQGVAKVKCDVAHDGSLTDCAVVSETPPDLGFGGAALKAAGVMRMNPWTTQGTPVDGMKILLPITLVMPDEPPPAQPPAK